MKPFLQFFLTLCLYVLTGQGHLHATPLRDNLRYTPREICTPSAHEWDIPDQFRFLFRSVLPEAGAQRVRMIVKETEDEDEKEDDKAASVKKPSPSGYFRGHFSPGLYGSLSQSSGYYPPAGSHCLCNASPRYILFRVIRI